MTKTINEHEGSKYLRRIYSAKNADKFILIDVYAVLKAFNVTCPARAHAIKKLLCAGDRGKGDALDDLLGAEAAISRAIELEQLDSLQETAGINTNKRWVCYECNNEFRGIPVTYKCSNGDIRYSACCLICGKVTEMQFK